MKTEEANAMESQPRSYLCCLCFIKRSPPGDQTSSEDSSMVFKNPSATEEDPKTNTSRNLLTPSGLYIALYDYSARTEEDLSFGTGDTLQVLSKGPGDWWVAQALSGSSASKKGYIPGNYVARLGSIDAEPWYFPDTKRLDAEKLLLAEGNQHGAFLIRNCESQKGELSLSVLDNGNVIHYKVRQLSNGQHYLTKIQPFQTLEELVKHYSKDADGLCVRLGEPCKKMEAPPTHGLSYDTVDKWEIDRSSIQLQQKLGAGQFGEVYKGVWNETTSVAVKTLKPGTMDPKDFLREAQIMKKLRHPCLIQLYAICTMMEPIYIITELMQNGSLQGYLQKDKGRTLRISHQIEMAAQVAAGMAFLEQQNYIHRDLAARNVLVGENNICKVADFGLARVFMKENGSVYEAKEGSKIPVKWTAPEAFSSNRFTIKSDVWSFGILLYEIATYGQTPYPDMTNFQVVQKLTEGYRMPRPANCSKVLYDIMLDCWNMNEQDRPTFDSLQWKLESFFE